LATRGLRAAFFIVFVLAFVAFFFTRFTIAYPSYSSSSGRRTRQSVDGIVTMIPALVDASPTSLPITRLLFILIPQYYLNSVHGLARSTPAAVRRAGGV
jgi:hypothetical protein